MCFSFSHFLVYDALPTSASETLTIILGRLRIKTGIQMGKVSCSAFYSKNQIFKNSPDILETDALFKGRRFLKIL